MREILAFGQRYRKEKLHGFNLQHRIPQIVEDYATLPQRREDFVVFCRDEGLSAITTNEQYDKKKDELSKKIKALSLPEAMDVLEHLRRQALVGKRLTQEVNLYLRAKDKSGKLPEQLTDEELRALGNQVDLPSPWGDGENKAKTLREHEDIVHPLILERSGQKGMYPQEKASFALHKETLIVQALHASLTKDFSASIAQRLGITQYQYAHLLGQSGSTEALIERFTVIPEVMDDWKQKGLMEFSVEFNRWNKTLLGPSREPRLADKAADILLPNGTQNKQYQEYLRACSISFFKKDRKDPAEIWHQVRKNMYQRLVEGFSQANQLGNPLLEDQARKLAVYVFTATQEPVNKPRESETLFWRASQKPLAESVVILKRLAYQEGLDQGPLLEEMRKRITAGGINPQELADKLEIVSKKIGEARSYYPELTLWDLPGEGYSSDWFVRETFCKASTLDYAGRYMPEKNYRDKIRVVKSPQAVKEIIDALREIPSSEE